MGGRRGLTIGEENDTKPSLGRIRALMSKPNSRNNLKEEYPGMLLKFWKKYTSAMFFPKNGNSTSRTTICKISWNSDKCTHTDEKTSNLNRKISKQQRVDLLLKL